MLSSWEALRHWMADTDVTPVIGIHSLVSGQAVITGNAEL